MVLCVITMFTDTAIFLIDNFMRGVEMVSFAIWGWVWYKKLLSELYDEETLFEDEA